MPPLIEALQDEHHAVRVDAAKSLGELSDPQATHALTSALCDEHPDVRKAAYWALMCLGLEARCDPPSFADALRSKWIERGRRFRHHSLKGRKFRRADHGVVSEVGRCWIAVLIEGDLFEQRLRHTLCDSAMYLSGCEQWVDDRAGVVYSDMTKNGRSACLDIDLDDAYVAPEREGLVFLLEI